ncbi:MAG: FAD-binding oxidoreductase [bacterium]
MVKTGKWAKIVGKGRAVTDPQVLRQYHSDMSFVSGKLPKCVVRPRSAQEVQAIVRLANAEGCALVPCSSGGPRTRGDTLPEADDALIVDLTGMDAIVRLDKRNKVALIEPGVSFGRLREAAAGQGLRVAMPLAPRKTKSVVASLLEREPTTYPKYHWDMSDPLCCLEVIFGTGDLFRTGGAAGPGTLEQQWASGQAQKSPMGPSQTDWAKIIQGAQGTMGIVTWASVKLELEPHAERAFLAGAQTPDVLLDFTYGILRPKLPDVCLMLNRANLSALLGEELAEDFPRWVAFYSISGYEHFPEERVDYIEQDIQDIARRTGVRPSRRLNGLAAQRLLSRVTAPSAEPYWKTRPGGAFHDVFFLTTLDRAPEFVGAMETEAARHRIPGRNLGIYLQPIQQGRGCHVELTLFYDPADPEQAAAVEQLFRNASARLMDLGAFFSRPYGPWAGPAYGKCPDTVAALKKVKGILDPRGVMNPGKLCFR